MVRDRLVYGTNSIKVRERFVSRGAELDLSMAINIARAHESAQSQLHKMTSEATVHSVRTNKGHKQRTEGDFRRTTRATNKKVMHTGDKSESCGYCLGRPHKKTSERPSVF